MEEYSKIWANVDSNPEEGFLFSNEIWKSYYTTSKILNNTFRSIVEFCADEGDSGSENIQAAKKAQYLKHLCLVYQKKIKWKTPHDRWYLNTLHPGTICPEKSLLDAVQQEIYCHMVEKLCQNNVKSVLSKEENFVLNALHRKVVEERPKFYKYVENMWEANKKRCHAIHPEVKKYVDAVWKIRLSSVNKYPQKYCDVKMVPLVFSGNSKLVRALPASKNASSTGIASRYVPPNYGSSLKVSTDFDEIASSFSPESFATKVPVSQDKTAQSITFSAAPDVVISMSGLKCIMDNFNPDYDREWDIPVTVREEELSKGPNYSKKVIYIDKPLPPRSMTTVDKNKWYHKYGIRALLCRPRSQGVQKFSVPVSPENLNKSSPQTKQNTSAEEEVSNANVATMKTEVKVKSDEAGNKSDDGGRRSGDGGRRSDDAGSRGDDAGSRTDDAGSRTDDAGSRTDDAGSRTDDAGSRSDDAGSRNDCAESGNDETAVGSSDEDSLYPSDSSTDRLVIACSDDENVRAHTQEKRSATHHSNSVQSQDKTKTAKKRRKSQSDDANKSKFCDDQNTDGNFWKKIKTYGRQSKKDSKLKKDVSSISATVQEPTKSSPSDSEAVPKEENCTSEEQSNPTNLMSSFSVSYKLWKLLLEKDSQEQTRANFLKNESSYRPIVILVRNKQADVRLINGEVRPVYLFSKLEYQSEYGMELPTMSDVCRQWVSLYFRDKCTLVRARTDAPTHKLLLVEDKKIEDVVREWFDQRIRSSLLSVLYSVLLGLLDVEPGDYLLSHRKKMGAFASLMKATDSDGSFDLTKLYESVDTGGPEVVTEISWPPLDVNLQTPNQYKQHQVPGVFQPCSAPQSPKRKPQNKFVKHKKKKKKKNKKQSEQQTRHAVPMELFINQRAQT